MITCRGEVGKSRMVLMNEGFGLCCYDHAAVIS